MAAVVKRPVLKTLKQHNYIQQLICIGYFLIRRYSLSCLSHITVIGTFTKKHTLNVFQRNIQNALQFDSQDKPHDYVLMILGRPT